jgi:hypothetical protein
MSLVKSLPIVESSERPQRRSLLSWVILTGYARASRQSGGFDRPECAFSAPLALAMPDRRTQSHRIKQDVDPDAHAWREPEEITRTLAFMFPRIGQVGVVHHDDHDPAVVVCDAAHIKGAPSSFQR